MDSQVARPQGQGYEQDPSAFGLHSVVEGGDNEHHREKKSVLKKVKAKAKKLKDTITKHDRGHDHPEGHVPDDHDLDEEDDEEEEVVEDPEIQGAPVFESVAIVSSVDAGRSLGTGEDRGTPTDARREEKFGKPRINLGSTRPTEEVVLRTPANTPQTAAPTRDPGTTQLSDPTRTFVHGKGEAERGRPTVNLARPGGLEEDPQSPGSRREPSNYQTKVPDPTASGGQEAGVSPIVRSLGKMAVQDGTGPEKGTDQSLPAETQAYFSNIPTGTGSHGQFSPEPTSMETDAALAGVDVTKPEADPRDQTEHNPSSPSSYTQKLSSATSVISEKAVSAKSLVASKLGYSERESPKCSDATGSETHTQGEKPSDQSSFTGKISSGTSAIADKAMLAKNIVAVKLGYGEKGDTTTSHDTGGTNSEPQAQESTAASGKPPGQSSYTRAISSIAEGSQGQFSPEPTSMETDTASLGVDVTKPEADPRDQTEHNPSSPSSYTEKLSSATSVISEKAVWAKNLVASKLGYSERESPKSSDATESETHTQSEKTSDQSSYTGKVPSGTSAIADKAMLAKNIVAVKLGYGEKGDTTTSHNTGGTNSEPQAHVSAAASGKPLEQSSYTRAISAIADKAVSTKDTVASKLAYAKKEGETETLGPGGNQPEKEQGKGIAATVTEKLSPVISKVTGSMTSQRAEAPGEGAGAQAQDKGVSVRDYLAEKLKPGEEHKALSEVISSALHKKKTATEAEAATAVKARESEEVKKQLREEGEGQLNSPGKRMVDTLRGTVGSWFSKTDESKASHQSARHDESEAAASAADEQHGGERRRQESSD